MLKKSNSVLKNLISLSRNRTAFKAGLYVLLLFWLSQNRSFWAAIIFLASSLYFYLKPISPINRTLFSFLFVFSSSFVAAWLGLEWFYFPIFGIFYFFILSVKNNVFKNNSVIFGILNNLLLFAAFVIFFWPNQPQWFFWKFIGLTVLVFFLIREFFFLPAPAERNQMAAVFSLLMVQLAWAIMFLPIGFLNASALMLVIVLIFKDLAAAYLNKSLDNVLIMKNVTILAMAGLIIFMASRWQP